MTLDSLEIAQVDVQSLTESWGDWEDVSLYLDRCQVDTPDHLVKATWTHIASLRDSISTVLDFGCGDARFAWHGKYDSYTGYEIDSSRSEGTFLAPNAKIKNECAFSSDIEDADICIGNPPFVRNQDLPNGWRQEVASILKKRTGVKLSGYSNAWQYFFLLSLASCHENGLCALVIPYEWVSRPSAKKIRDYIRTNNWDVSVYRLIDTTFDSVLTTSSITIIDKASKNGTWSYYAEDSQGRFTKLKSPSGDKSGVIKYLSARDMKPTDPRARRGVSPGTQKVLTLTNEERLQGNLKVGSDVVRCITSLRYMPNHENILDIDTFNKYYRDGEEKCWLVRTDKEPSVRLKAYLNSIPESDYQTSTCLNRKLWWKFSMPSVPNALLSQCFRGKFPKVVINKLKVRAVGGVCGIYGLNGQQAQELAEGLDNLDISGKVVAHSNGLKKIEINQLNTILLEAFGD